MSSMDLSVLKPHPSQPPSRTRNTKQLQRSLRAKGQIQPVVLAGDGVTVLSGWRRTTAARALKWETIDVLIRTDIKADSTEALGIVLSSNVHTAMSHMEKVHVLRGYEQHGISLRQAAKRAGISPTEACFLAKLAKAPDKAQEAVERYDRSGGKSGMSFAAFKEIAKLSKEEQLKVIEKKARVSVNVARNARKKVAAATAEARLVEGDDAALALAQNLRQATWLLYAYLMTLEGEDLANAGQEIADVFTDHTHSAVINDIIEKGKRHD